MGLEISESCNASPAYAIRNVRTGGSQTQVDTARGAGAGESGHDTVQLSSEGRLAVSELLNSLILPTEENVQGLSKTLSKDLGNLLTGLGISANPPIEFSVGASGEILIKGDRADRDQILQAVNGNEKVKQEIRTTAAISSHAAAIAESLKFQREYVASTCPESVAAKYSYLFSSHQRSRQISLVFNGDSINVLSDGKAWPSSGADTQAET